MKHTLVSKCKIGSLTQKLISDNKYHHLQSKEYIPWRMSKVVLQQGKDLLPQTSTTTAQHQISGRATQTGKQHRWKTHTLVDMRIQKGDIFTWSVTVPRSINVNRKMIAPAIPYERTRPYSWTEQTIHNSFKTNINIEILRTYEPKIRMLKGLLKTWYISGTLKYLKIRTNTKRLSTDKLCSNKYLKSPNIKRCSK